MNNLQRVTDEDRWQSVLQRDADADGQFVLPYRPRVSFVDRHVGLNMRCVKCPFLCRCRAGVSGRISSLQTLSAG